MAQTTARIHIKLWIFILHVCFESRRAGHILQHVFFLFLRVRIIRKLGHNLSLQYISNSTFINHPVFRYTGHF